LNAKYSVTDITTEIWATLLMACIFSLKSTNKKLRNLNPKSFFLADSGYKSEAL